MQFCASWQTRQNLPFEIAGAATTAELAERSAHPLWLVERWWREFGGDTARQICGYDQRVPETAIRLDSAATDLELSAEGVELAAGQLTSLARRVLAGDVTKTRAFREGRVAIQDEASQLVALLVGRGARILDCCAAPGGKTRVLAQRNPASEVVAVELHSHRARLLSKLVPEKNVRIVMGDIGEFPVGDLFDCVLADVPCSGTGTLARNPEIKWRLQPADLADLHRRQVEILRAAMRQVAPGGRLVYSTCSLEPEENADVVREALASDPSFRVLDCGVELERLRSNGDVVADWGSLTRGNYLRTVPGVQHCDGFFAAVLRRG